MPMLPCEYDFYKSPVFSIYMTEEPLNLFKKKNLE